MAKKLILLSIPYSTQLALPVELAGFLPEAFVVEHEGYGTAKKSWRSKSDIEVTFIDPDTIATSRPEPEAAAPETNIPESDIAF